MVGVSIRQDDLKLLSALNQRKVRYIVIGGVAVQFFGCREWDDVDDLDLLMPAENRNAQRFLNTLADMGIANCWCVKDVASHAKKIPLKGSPYYTEVLTAKLEADFDGLYARSVETKKNGVLFRIMSKTDLIEMKRESAGKSAKHRKDLECLLAD